MVPVSPSLKGKVTLEGVRKEKRTRVPSPGLFLDSLLPSLKFYTSVQTGLRMLLLETTVLRINETVPLQHYINYMRFLRSL